MKKVDLTVLDEEEFEKAMDSYAGFCDCKESPEEVLEEVDGLLKKFGLEVVLADAGSSDVLFEIKKRKRGKSKT